MKRELNKAYCGFYSDNKNISIPVATGNWGCGAFRGFSRLKCLIQFMACVVNKRNLVYYTFNDYTLQLDMEEMFDFLSDNNITVGELWKCLLSFDSSKGFNQLYKHIREQCLMEKEVADVSKLIEEEEVSDVSTLIEEEEKESVSSQKEEVESDISPRKEHNFPKRTKIDNQQLDSTPDAENTSSLPLVAPKNNKLITDYFRKLST